MTNATEIVKKGTVPTDQKEAAEEISKQVAEAYSVLPDTPEQIPLTIRLHVFKRLSDSQREKFGITHYDVADFEGVDDVDEEGNERVVEFTDENGERIFVDHPLHNAAKHHGLHAYRYVECEDGSAYAIYANDPSGEIKLKAFADMAEASRWSPRDER